MQLYFDGQNSVNDGYPWLKLKLYLRAEQLPSYNCWETLRKHLLGAFVAYRDGSSCPLQQQLSHLGKGGHNYMDVCKMTFFLQIQPLSSPAFITKVLYPSRNAQIFFPKEVGRNWPNMQTSHSWVSIFSVNINL